MAIKKSDLYSSLGDAYEYLMRHFATESGKSKGQFYTPSEVNVVANPPFSDKTWSTGLTPSNDPWQRFAWGEPPTRQGDYAYLLHIIRSLKGAGKGACILPHGVLFRGNAEAVIRRQLVRSGILEGIIGLPAKLFFGTGIPACILVLDKENATARKGVFMIDASKGYLKDGNKNRLREQDIHRIVDTFTRQIDTPRYARLVPFDEIADAKNDFNLNLPRYIDSSEPDHLQDIDGHLRGGIPERDLDALKRTVRESEAALDRLAYERYPTLGEAEIKALVVDDKWMARIAASVQGELDRVSQTLTGRIRELAERYATPLPQLEHEVAALAARVEEHLKRMGATWN
jgi:type I restriction-modification system DNA methylase subunit